MGNEQNVIKNFASTITSEENDYNGYYEINISSKEWFDEFQNSKETRTILDRTSKYKEQDKAQEMKEEEDDKQEEEAEEGTIFNDIMENMDGHGVFKLKTNHYRFTKCKFCIETKHILAFSEFHDAIESISLQRKKETQNDSTTSIYLISFIYPPSNTPFELFKYKIKHIATQTKTPFLKINYTIRRMTSDLQSKWMEKKCDPELRWIEEYEICVTSRFDTMVSDCDIWIPIRCLQNKHISSLSIHSNVLKWGSVQQIQMGQMQFIKWHLRFIKGSGSHSVTLDIQMAAKDKQTADDVLSRKCEGFSNYEHDESDEWIRDSVIKCSWSKHYFALSGMMVTRYFVAKNDETHNITPWIRRNTEKSCTVDMQSTDAFACLKDLHTMKGSIVTLDRRKALLKKQHVLMNATMEMKHIAAKNEIFIDCHENEKGGVILVKNHICGTANVLKYCVKMKDELLFITRYHPSLLLVEYKLVKTKKGYRYVYWMYSFAAPYGEFELIRYKRSDNKSLIELKCSKYILEKKKKGQSEWSEHYRFTLNSHFSAKFIASDLCLNIPVFINSAQQKNIAIKSFGSGLLQKGKLRYSESGQSLRWNINSFKGKSEITRNVEFKLCKKNEEIELGYVTQDDKNNVLVFGECEINKMQIPDHTLSGIGISAVKLVNNQAQQIKYEVWIRYCTLIASGRIIFRVHGFSSTNACSS
eukprot:45750_1